MDMFVIYALPEKYATSIRLKNLMKNLRSTNVKEIRQDYWPDFFVLKILVLLKQIIKSLILTRKDDTIYASAPLLASSMPAVITKKLKGSKLIADWDDSFEDLSKKIPEIWDINYWEYKAVKEADKVIAVSRKLENAASKIRGSGKDVFYIPNGVNTKLFDPAKYNSKTIRKNIGISESEVVIGVVGKIGKVRGILAYHEIISIAPSILKKYSNAKFLVVGYGKGLDEFKRLVKKNSLEEHFIFTGYVQHKYVPHYISAMDICIVPFGKFFTSYSRSSVKLKECMSMQKAVIATNAGENITDLKNGECGILVNNVKQMGTMAEKLIKEKTLRIILGEKARKRAISEYDYKILGEKLSNVINAKK